MLSLPLSTIYPGHRAIITHPQKRITQLLDHHAQRLLETYNILATYQEAQAYTVASHMAWSLRGHWTDYKAQQQCFAVGEAIAHLDHLTEQGHVQRHKSADALWYTTITSA